MAGRRTRPSAWLWLAVALIAIVGLAMIALAVSGGSSNHKSASNAGDGPPVSVATSDTTSPTPSDTAAAPAEAPLSTASVSEPSSPLETTGGITVNSAGAVLPDPARTPGAVNPDVTQADIGRTICVTGWTATIRPSSSYTTALKERQLATGYAYHGDQRTADYEEDHLISLELGGSPKAESNLWPEPYNVPDGARVKDVVENKLHDLVCAGTLLLATAQHAIATNWWAAYITYVGAPPAPHSSSYHAPAPTSAHTSAPAGHPAGATARCRDGTYSYAAHHQGACSHHGGVAIFYT